MKTNVVTGKEAVERLVAGIKIATEAIKPTYGPKGLNAVIEADLRPFHIIANDAQTIVQSLEVEDKVEKQGLSFAKELMDKADKDSGDGRKTTLILLDAVIDACIKSDLKGIDIKKALDEAIPVIESLIDKEKRSISIEDISEVARISGESEEIGDTVGNIYRDIGKDGIIIPEGSGTYQTYYTTIDGVRFIDTGYLSPYMVHDEEAVKSGQRETKAIYEYPTILVTKRKISHLNDINPLLERLTKEGKKDLVIFTDDMDSGVASIMVKAHQDKVLNILIIKAPTLWKNYVFEDFAKITGATIVEDATGVNFKNLQLGHLGTCARITVERDETTIVGGSDISDHIAYLKSQDDNDSKLRLSWLTTKTALLKIGSNNESELSYKRLKYADAINSSRLALRDGVVEGGGVCLNNVADALPDTEIGTILKAALRAPYLRIRESMDVQGVLDASAVVKNAVRNAISLASTILTTGIVVTMPDKTADQIAQDALKNKGFRF